MQNMTAPMNNHLYLFIKSGFVNGSSSIVDLLGTMPLLRYAAERMMLSISPVFVKPAPFKTTFTFSLDRTEKFHILCLLLIQFPYIVMEIAETLTATDALVKSFFIISKTRTPDYRFHRKDLNKSLLSWNLLTFCACAPYIKAWYAKKRAC